MRNLPLTHTPIIPHTQSSTSAKHRRPAPLHCPAQVYRASLLNNRIPARPQTRANQPIPPRKKTFRRYLHPGAPQIATFPEKHSQKRTFQSAPYLHPICTLSTPHVHPICIPSATALSVQSAKIGVIPTGYKVSRAPSPPQHRLCHPRPLCLKQVRATASQRPITQPALHRPSAQSEVSNPKIIPSLTLPPTNHCPLTTNHSLSPFCHPPITGPVTQGTRRNVCPSSSNSLPSATKATRL